MTSHKISVDRYGNVSDSTIKGPSDSPAYLRCLITEKVVVLHKTRYIIDQSKMQL